MKFIASHPGRRRSSSCMFEMLAQGPANPAADALIPADEAAASIRSIRPISPCRSRSTWRGTRNITAPRSERLPKDHFCLTAPPLRGPSEAAGADREATHANVPSRRILLGPLVLFLGLSYVLPFLGVMEWSVTLPRPGVGQIPNRAERSFGPCPSSPHAADLRDGHRAVRHSRLCRSHCFGCVGGRFSAFWSRSAS